MVFAYAEYVDIYDHWHFVRVSVTTKGEGRKDERGQKYKYGSDLSQTLDDPDDLLG